MNLNITRHQLPRIRVLIVFVATLFGVSVFLHHRMQTAQAVAGGSGSISLTTLGIAYTQNFDTLANAGTTNNLTINGWRLNEEGTSTSNNGQYAAGTGSGNAGDVYSFGATATTERSFGTLFSGTLTPTIGASFTNNTGSTVTSLDISYNGEQWRLGQNTVGRAPDRLDFQLSTNATSLTTGTWTDFNSLDFASPVVSGTVGALNGNSNQTPVSFSITGLSIPDGASFWIRWTDSDLSPGADDGLAVDDFSITPHAGDLLTLSINDVTVTEGDSGPVTASFTVSLSSSVHSGVTFDISTQDDSATTADNDYAANTLISQSIPGGQQSYTFDVIVNGDTTFEPNETFFVNVTNVSGATVLDGQGIGTITNDDCPAAPGDIVISQVYGGGGNASAPFQSDYIELFNRGASTVNLSGWSVQYTSATGTGTWQVTMLTGSIAPGGYYLVQESTGTGCSGSPCGVPLPTPDYTGPIMMNGTAGKVALSSSTAAFSGMCPTCAIDLVGYGATASCFEGAGPTGAPSNTTAALRKRGGCFDSNNNNVDFSVGAPNPRNTASPTNNCAPISLAIHDIQGSGPTTPYAGQFVSTSGIVTALKTNGFFMQEPDASVDIDPATSEGIFVFTSTAPAVATGDSVSIVGTASEFFNLTQVESTLPGDVVVNTTGNTPPTPVVLTTTILDPAGTPDQLERFEGMLMHADTLVSVAPSNEFGETFTVLDGVARPLREPGIEISLTVPSDPSSTANVPRWDENPERIMIDSDGLAGHSAISVTSNVTFSNVTGPLDFNFGDYKIDPEIAPTTSANMSAVPVPTPATGEFTIAGFNIENFNNNATQRHKAALAIRDVLHLPDIIGTIEIFELSGLEALADEINTLSGTTSYQAYLVEADGTSGDADQDVGFLINTSRVQVNSTTQEELPGCDGTPANCNTFIDPNTNNPALLNDRPPLVLRATVDPSGTNPVPVIVIVNHLRSFIDIEDLGTEGARVRAKRKAQGEFLANLLQDLQTNNPATAIMSIGDYNAYQFNDGYTDPVSVIKGTPTADDEMVVDQSLDLVSPDFINLTDGLPADQKYSFIFEGTPQALDHMIVNTVANAMLQRYAVARNNSDFPEVPASAFANDVTRPERCSDHDMPVAYFKPLADLSITKSASPEPVVTGSDVTYTITVTNNGPNTAQAVVVTDNLPAETTFGSCNATGSGVCGGTGNNRTVTFSSLTSGSSETITLVATVNCEVTDGFDISNTASVSSDTDDPDTGNNSQTAMTTASDPPPTISCPDDITLEPTCPSGAIATYTTPVGSDNCPDATTTLTAGFASGSVFPIGPTTVTYTVTDGNGQTASCSFTVTVLTPQTVVQNLINSVNASSLIGTQKNGLLAKLNAALDAINQGKNNVACNKLADFINSVQNLINHGNISAAQGQEWIDSAAHVRNTLGCTNLGCT